MQRCFTKSHAAPSAGPSSSSLRKCNCEILGLFGIWAAWDWMNLAIKDGETCAQNFNPRRIAPSTSPALAMSFPCSDCEQTFENAAARRHHRWNQHSTIPPITVAGKEYTVQWEGGRLWCPAGRCGRSYSSREAFAKHVKAAHGIKSEPSIRSPPPARLSQQAILSQRLSSASSGSKSDVLLHL